MSLRAASILIVDDEPANLKLLRSMLAEHGYVVRFATRGKLALESVQAEPPNLILLDIDLPDIVGYDVCLRLKADPATSGIPVLFISADNDARAKVRSFQVGGVDYISKPFQAEEVLARINHQLTIHDQQEQIERQAARLRELDTLKSRFFTDISHEFRTPLMLTAGLVESVRDGQYGPLREDARKELDRALLHANRLEELIAQILDLSRAEAGVTQLQMRRFNLSDCLQSVVLSFAPLAERQHLTLQLVIPPTSVYLYADPEALIKVITNLLSNAFKHTSAGGRIDLLATFENAENVSIAVRDTGTGIPEDVLPHVFDRFYSRSSTSANGQSGTGIGLALARELVQRHGGTIKAESEEGKGTTFTVTLPNLEMQSRNGAGEEDSLSDEVVRIGNLAMRSAEAKALSAGYLEPEEIHISDGDVDDRPSLLIVDDNAEVRRYLRMCLAAQYHIIEAADGKQGLDRIREHLPDLIISDLQMPRMDGAAFCRAVKSDPELDFIPVILLTVKADAGHRFEGLEAGADDYLTKPFDSAELKVRVRNLIRLRQRLRERLASEPRPKEELPVGAISSDDLFVHRLRSVLVAHLNDPDFTVEDLASELAQDRTTLYRWIRRLTGQSPSDMLRSVRLQHGATLLGSRAGSVSEIAYGVGFRSVQHFVRSFRKEFGVTPSAYMMQAEPASSSPNPGMS